MIYSTSTSSPPLTSPASSPSVPPSSAPALTSPSPLSSPSFSSSPHLISPSSSPPPPPSSPAASKLTTSLFSLLHLFLLSLDSLLLTIYYFPHLLFSNFLLLSHGILAPTLSSKLSFLSSLPSSHLPPLLSSSPSLLSCSLETHNIPILPSPPLHSLPRLSPHHPPLPLPPLLQLHPPLPQRPHLHISALLTIQPHTLTLHPAYFATTIDAATRFGLCPETTIFIDAISCQSPFSPVLPSLIPLC